MRSEKEINDMLLELRKVSKTENPDCPYDIVPFAQIKNELLRCEIYMLEWALDLIG